MSDRRFLDRFNDYCLSKRPPLQSSPASSSTVALFITYLHESNFSASTICSHLSAISFSHKLSGDPDPCQSFIIQRMILGCKKGFKTSDRRLPILKPMLCQLVNSCSLLSGGFDKILYQALLLVTYNGFFRIGEILPSKKSKKGKVIQLTHTRVSPSSILIELQNYKTRRSQTPLIVTIKASGGSYCPVKKLRQYLNIRGNTQGPLFLNWNDSPVLTSQFNRTLKCLLNWGNFPCDVYKAHSLRIGACSQSILSGLPERVVMGLGRRKSYSAFKRYVRLQNVP